MLEKFGLFQLYMVVVAGLPPNQVNIHLLLSFMKYLHSNQITLANISNHLAAIRAYFIVYLLPKHSFRDEKINKMFVRSLKINRPLVVKNTSVFTDSLHLKIRMSSVVYIPVSFWPSFHFKAL